MDIRTTATKLLVYTVFGVTVATIAILILPYPLSENEKVDSNRINPDNVSYPKMGLDRISNSTEIIEANSLLRLHKVNIQASHTGLVEYSIGLNKHTIRWAGNTMIYQSPRNTYYSDKSGIHNRSSLKNATIEDTKNNIDSYQLVNTYYDLIVEGIPFLPKSQIQETIERDIKSQDFIAESAIQHTNGTTIIEYVSDTGADLKITNHSRVIYYKSPSSMIEYRNKVQTSDALLPPNWYLNKTN